MNETELKALVRSLKDRLQKAWDERDEEHREVIRVQRRFEQYALEVGRVQHNYEETIEDLTRLLELRSHEMRVVMNVLEFMENRLATTPAIVVDHENGESDA